MTHNTDREPEPTPGNRQPEPDEPTDDAPIHSDLALPPSTDDLLAEIAASPLSDDLAEVVALVHALRSSDGIAACLMVVDLMAEDNYAVYLMLVKAVHLLACICDERKIPTEEFARWAQVATLRRRRAA